MDIYTKNVGKDPKRTDQYGPEYALVRSPRDEVRPTVTFDIMLLFEISGLGDGSSLRIMSIPGQSSYQHIREPAPIDAVPGSQVDPAPVPGSPMVVYADNRTGQFELRATQLRYGRQIGGSWPVMQDGYGD